MLWKKTWQPEAVLALGGGLVSAFLLGAVTVGLLQRAHVRGFENDVSGGAVLLGTLSFHGAALVCGATFLKLHGIAWSEVLNTQNWKRNCVSAVLTLLIVTPIMLLLKIGSELALQKLGWPAPDQRAVEIILGAKSVWLRAYLICFAVALAPVAEEFVFRGLLFSAAKKLGWPRLGGLGASFLFAAFHLNLPTFLPLFAFALALTWLYERTEGLMAPIAAHSLFNTANLALLYLQKS
jgi:membrane protease YdiL (CAAX protease family)